MKYRILAVIPLMVILLNCRPTAYTNSEKRRLQLAKYEKIASECFTRDIRQPADRVASLFDVEHLARAERKGREAWPAFHKQMSQSAELAEAWNHLFERVEACLLPGMEEKDSLDSEERRDLQSEAFDHLFWREIAWELDRLVLQRHQKNFSQISSDVLQALIKHEAGSVESFATAVKKKGEAAAEEIIAQLRDMSLKAALTGEVVDPRWIQQDNLTALCRSCLRLAEALEGPLKNGLQWHYYQKSKLYRVRWQGYYEDYPSTGTSYFNWFLLKLSQLRETN